jgi:glucokinase
MTKNASSKPVIGIDLGATKILAGVVAADGEILGTAKRATKAQAGPDAVVDRIVKTVREAADAADVDLEALAAIGSGAPGPLDPDRGIVLHTPNMPGWDNVPLASLLSERLGAPAYLGNDVDLGTLGESALGAGRGCQHVVGIFVGTGIGGGLILNGQLWQGWRRAAAEIGHMIVLADGPYCGCGNRGCLEAVASRTAIERDILAGIKAGRESVLAALIAPEKGRLTSGALEAACKQGDTLVAEVLGRAQFYLGLAVASVVNFIDPEMVILGGGVVEAFGESFLEPIRRTALQNFINKRGAREVRIVPAKLGDNAALLGAAVYARHRLAARTSDL